MRNRTRSRRNIAAKPRRTGMKMPAWAGIAVLACAGFLFASGYLAQIGATSSKGYAIRSLQGEIDALKEEQEKLEFEVAKDRSMASVEEKVAALGMVPVSDIEYLTASDPIVAKR